MPKPEDYAARRLAELIPISAGAAPKPSVPIPTPTPSNEGSQVNLSPRSPGPRQPDDDIRTRSNRSTLNATRHGLSGRVVVMPGEDMGLYFEFSKKIVSSLNPETPIEEELAHSIADGHWRLKRVRTVEEGMFGWAHYEAEGRFDAQNQNAHSAFAAAASFRNHSQAFVNLSIYEQRIQRGIDRAMKQLHDLQAERKARKEEVIQEAIRLRQYQLMMAANNPNHPDAHEPDKEPESGDIEVGPHVCSIAGTDREIVTRTRRARAHQAEKANFNYPTFQSAAA